MSSYMGIREHPTRSLTWPKRWGLKSGSNLCLLPVTGARQQILSHGSRIRYPSPPSLAQSTPRRGDEIMALTPYPTLYSIHSGKLQVLLGHGSSRQHPGSVEHQRPEVCGALCAGYGRGQMCDRESSQEACLSMLSLSAPELLDCDRCQNGCQGGFVWDAYMTVLNNS